MDHFKVAPAPLTLVHKPPFSVEVPGVEKVPGESIPRRHPKAVNGLISRPFDDVATVWDTLKRSARIYPNHNAVGSRKLIKLHKETKMVPKNIDGQVKEVEKQWQYFELSPYTFITYKDYLARVKNLASGLRKLGVDSNEKLHFFATTR
jgi:long-chain acyl-CoA synthetase